MWLPAQHDTGAGGMLAHQNAEADRLAGEAPDQSQPIEVPLRPLLSGRVVGVATGAFCPSPSKAYAALHDAAVTAMISTAFRAGDPLWSARAYAKLLISRALPPRSCGSRSSVRLSTSRGTPRTWQRPYAPSMTGWLLTRATASEERALKPSYASSTCRAPFVLAWRSCPLQPPLPPALPQLRPALRLSPSRAEL